MGLRKHRSSHNRNLRYSYQDSHGSRFLNEILEGSVFASSHISPVPQISITISGNDSRMVGIARTKTSKPLRCSRRPTNKILTELLWRTLLFLNSVLNLVDMPCGMSLNLVGFKFSNRETSFAWFWVWVTIWLLLRICFSSNFAARRKFRSGVWFSLLKICPHGCGDPSKEGGLL